MFSLSFFVLTRYIDEEDLLRFMIKEEVDLIFPLFEGSETGRIDRKALTDWVVRLFFFPNDWCFLMVLLPHAF